MGVALGVRVKSVVGRGVVVVESREAGRWEEVGTGTAIAGAYIWGMVSGGEWLGGWSVDLIGCLLLKIIETEDLKWKKLRYLGVVILRLCAASNVEILYQNFLNARNQTTRIFPRKECFCRIVNPPSRYTSPASQP